MSQKQVKSFKKDSLPENDRSLMGETVCDNCFSVNIFVGGSPSTGYTLSLLDLTNQNIFYENTNTIKMQL